MLKRGLSVCQAGGLQLLLLYVGSPLGYAYALSGRLAEALPLLEQVVEQSAATEHMGFYPLFVAHLGEAYLLAGRITDASQQAQHVEEQHGTSSNAATRPMRCGSSVRLPPSASPRMPRQPQPPTDKP